MVLHLPRRLRAGFLPVDGLTGGTLQTAVLRATSDTLNTTTPPEEAQERSGWIRWDIQRRASETCSAIKPISVLLFHALIHFIQTKYIFHKIVINLETGWFG